MKVGILTFHRACNYGAVLQCYALQETLKDMGHEVSVIDYRPSYIERAYKYFRFKTLIKNCVLIYRFPSYLRRMLTCYKFKWYFCRFRSEYLHVKDKCLTGFEVPKDYDCYLVGSDQLLNINLTRGIDSVYSLNFETNPNSLKVGYAISMNASSVSEIGKRWDEICGRFSDFSVREHKYAIEIQNYTSKKISTCLDPTLLTNASLWDKMIQKKIVRDKYVVLYQVRFPKSNPSVITDKALEFARCNGYQLIDLSSKKYAVDEWVSLIAHAERVITSSFHATAFALIFKRALNAFVLNDGMDDRYSTLLKSVEAECCLTQLDDSIDQVPHVNWDIVSEKMKDIRISSIEYLNNSMQQYIADNQLITPPIINMT
jgi:hypothetical protein